MSEIQFALGLDVAKKSVEGVLLSQTGERQSLAFANGPSGFSKLESWLEGLEKTAIHVCLEPTGRYSRGLAQFLHTRDYQISQVNSYTVLCHGRANRKINKNDRIDAFLLADYCLKNRPALWNSISSIKREVRDLQERIYDLEEAIRQERNRLEAGTDSALARQDIEEQIVGLESRRERLQNALVSLIYSDDSLRSDFEILKSIIGVGEKTATHLLAHVQFEKFDDGRKTAAFAGLVPKEYRSGTSVRRRDIISRAGNPKLRQSLYFPAMVAMQHNPQMRAFADRLRERGKPSKVIICAVMRKLVVLAAALLRNRCFYDPAHGLTSS